MDLLSNKVTPPHFSAKTRFLSHVFSVAALFVLSALTIPEALAGGPSAPSTSVNPQIDPGIQGALPRYNTSPGVTNHLFMAPKNTPAQTIVDEFPWLYMDVDTKAQYLLYRGTGGNNNADVVNPLNLNAGEFQLAPSNTDDLSAGGNGGDNGAAIQTQVLNQNKCLPLQFLPNACVPIWGGGPFDLLGETVGAALSEQDYISKSPALFNRLQFDSCTNQVILPQALNPNAVFNDDLRNHDVGWNETWCQPFKMVPVDCFRNTLMSTSQCLQDAGENDNNLYDYRAWGYLRLAWRGVLKDPYTPSGGTGLYYGGEFGIGDPPYLTELMLYLNAGIPAITGLTFPGTLQLVNISDTEKAATGAAQFHVEIPGDEQLGDPLVPFFPGGSVGPIGAAVSMFTSNYTGNKTTINDLASRPYERIWDPTHPYSPRWDFKGTDRMFSALARINGVMFLGYDTGTSACIVRCASVPVDILTFRLLAFAACMGCRIAVNTICFWTQAMWLMTEIYYDFKDTFGIPFRIIFCHQVDEDTAINDTIHNRVEPIAIPNNWPDDQAQHYVGDGFPDNFMYPGSTEDGSFVIDVSIDGCHFDYGPELFCKSIADNITAKGTSGSNTSGPQPNETTYSWPVCSTKYDYKDPLWGLLFCFPCTYLSGETNIYNGVRTCCDDLAHALAPLNTLKIRNTLFNHGLLPTPEGYAFQEYFTNQDSTRVDPYDTTITGYWDNNGSGNSKDTLVEAHMPYMRWWDTGASAGGAGSFVGIRDYDPDSDCGYFDTIVGVGTEDWKGDPTQAHNANDSAVGNYNLAKYCRYGGNGYAIDADTGLPLTFEAITNIGNALLGATTTATLENMLHVDLNDLGIPPFYNCIRLRTIDWGHKKLGPDALTSWAELKMYQTRAIQNYGLNCLPQYEKLHKVNGAEEAVLLRAGGSYKIPVYMNRSAGDDSNVDPDNGYYKVQYKGAAPANPGPIGGTADAPNGNVSGAGNNIELQTVAWPLSWRGYNSDDKCHDAYPYFSGDGTSWGMSASFTSWIPGSPAGLLVMPCLADVGAPSGGGGAGYGFGVPGLESPYGNVPLFGIAPYGYKIGLGYPDTWPIMPGGLDEAEVGDTVFLTGEDIGDALGIAYVNYADHLFGSAELPYFAAPMPMVGVVNAIHTMYLGSDGQQHTPEDTVANCPATEPNCFTTCEEYVIVEEVNGGKFPDVCGNTDTYGHGQSRMIFREWLPTDVLDTIYPPGTVVEDTCGHSYTTVPNGVTALAYTDPTANNEVFMGLYNSNFGSCADPKMSRCTFADLGFGFTNSDSVNLWEHFRIYRPTYDYRQ